MACITNHSIFKPSNKYISSNDINIIEGVKTLHKFDMCGLKIPFAQYFASYIYLQPNSLNNEINYGGLGRQITYLAIKVTYEKNPKMLPTTDDLPYIEYFFENNTSEIRTISEIMILTGNVTKKLPKIFINNTSDFYTAKIDILAATTEITWDSYPTGIQIGENLFTLSDLKWKNLLSDTTNNGLIVNDDEGNSLVYITWSSISNVELNGRIMLIDDMGTGKIELQFQTEFDCLQSYSLITWVLSNPTNNLITLSTLADTTSPVITYASTFTTDIHLNSYGTSGNYIITKNNLITLLILNVNDNRDGAKYIDSNNIRITKLNQNVEIGAITEVGKYNLIISVEDNAKNNTINSFVLTIKDATLPFVILNDLGLDFYSINNSGTSGTSAIQQILYIDDYSFKTIGKQDLIDLFIGRVTDYYDGDYNRDLTKIQVTIKDHYSSLAFGEITTDGIFDIFFVIENSLNSISDGLYSNLSTKLLPTNYLTLVVSKNKKPTVVFNDISTQFLLSYIGNTITKSNLNTLLVDSVTDDRDGLITTNILNLSIYGYATLGIAGTNAFQYTSGTSFYDMSYYPQPVPEFVNIVDGGQYTIKIIVVDSDGLVTIADKIITVL